MTDQRPLSLKRERAQSANRSRISNLIADVLVDHEILHLTQTFSYGIPDALRAVVHVGSTVRVPFRNSEKPGVVVGIRSDNESVKTISKALNSWAFSRSTLELAKEVAQRYGSHQLEILNSVPSRSNQPWPIDIANRNSESDRRFIAIRQDSFEELITHLKMRKGSSLIIFPTEREASHFYDKVVRNSNRKCLNYFGPNSAKVNKALEDSMRSGEEVVVVSCRGGVFLQIANLVEMVIVDEQAEDFWELRRPYWNVRDVSLIRSRLEKLDLIFLSSAPSLELTRLIEAGYIKNERKLPKLSRRNIFDFEDAGYVRAIRHGLQEGAVLVSVAEKSYSGSFLCANCRNSPRCSCGALLRSKSKENLECKVCGFSSSGWKCNECGSSKMLFLRKGAERIHEELGKAFPKTPILISTAEKPIHEVSSGSIVIATPGMQPPSVRFAALVLLDGWVFLNRPGLRAEESLRRHWFRLLSQTKGGARVYVSLPRSNSISQDLVQGNALKGSLRQLADRNPTKLPPAYRVILLSGNNVADIVLKLKSEFPGIEPSRSSESSAIAIRVKVEEAQSLVDALSALNRYRSVSRRDLLRIQIDPYDV